MAAEAFELYGGDGCLLELEVAEDVSNVGVVEEVVQEARCLVVVQVLVVSKRRNAQSIGQSPLLRQPYHLVKTSFASFYSSSGSGAGSKKKLSWAGSPSSMLICIIFNIKSNLIEGIIAERGYGQSTPRGWLAPSRRPKASGPVHSSIFQGPCACWGR